MSVLYGCVVCPYLEPAWGFLNESLIASALGAFLGIWGAIWVRRYFGRLEENRLEKQLRALIVTEVMHNLETVQDIHQDMLPNQSVFTDSEPFRTDGLSVTLNGRFVEIMKPELAAKVAELLAHLRTANRLHRELFQRSIGLIAFLPLDQGSSRRLAVVREQVRGRFSGGIDDIKKAANELLTMLGQPPVETIQETSELLEESQPVL
jgi:hypothetical protein